LVRHATSILANERNNVKFNFLVSGDPYHAYYQHKVVCTLVALPSLSYHAAVSDVATPAGSGVQSGRRRRRAEGAARGACTSSASACGCRTGLTPAHVVALLNSQAAKAVTAPDTEAPTKVAVQTATNFKPVVLEAPEKVCACLPPAAFLADESYDKFGTKVCAVRIISFQEQYTVALPDGVSAFDLDVIKLTAQFVARNGKSFLTGLTSREHMNPQARPHAVQARLSALVHVRLTRGACSSTSSSHRTACSASSLRLQTRTLRCSCPPSQWRSACNETQRSRPRCSTAAYAAWSGIVRKSGAPPACVSAVANECSPVCRNAF
jgi:hypothetical protein